MMGGCTEDQSQNLKLGARARGRFLAALLRKAARKSSPRPQGPGRPPPRRERPAAVIRTVVRLLRKKRALRRKVVVIATPNFSNARNFRDDANAGWPPGPRVHRWSLP